MMTRQRNDQTDNDSIARKVKQLRTERGLTLEKLGLMVGCTKAYISQVEKGLSTPSVSMLGKIAEALNVSVTELFRIDNNNQVRTWKLPRSERRKIHYPDGKVESELLTRGVFQKKMQPMISVIEPGGVSDETGYSKHPTGSEEFVLVLKGSVEFRVAEETISLETGDTLYFDGDLPHRWKNLGKKAAELLFVWTPPVW